MISAPDAICHAQLFPFFYHARELGQRYQVELREVPLARWVSGDHPYQDEVAAVCLQTWFDLKPQQLRELIRRVKSLYPGTSLAYFDWFAPTDLRFAPVVTDDIVLYLKKHVLRDRSSYDRPTLGDTNLTDYYSRRFGLDEAEKRVTIPEKFWRTLALGTHFAFAPHMLTNFLGHFPQAKRTIDLHARITVEGAPWYRHMREEALQAVRALPSSAKTVCQGKVPREQYIKELFQSRICFSPFGYGEVCWRDFEAIFSGSLLLKPDMSHLKCYPEIFIPNETYVALEWDLSNFQSIVKYYLSNEKERLRITRNAFELLHDYFAQDQFLTDIDPVVNTLLGS